MTWFEATLNWLTKTIPWQIMFGLFIMIGVLLFFPHQLNIYEWSHPYRGIEIATFSFSGAVLLANISSAWVVRGVHHYVIRRRGKKHLHNLSPEEKRFCKHFVDTNGSSLPHNPANGAISNLLAYGVLLQPPQGWGLEERGRDWLFEFPRPRILLDTEL